MPPHECCVRSLLALPCPFDRGHEAAPVARVDLLCYGPSVDLQDHLTPQFFYDLWRVPDPNPDSPPLLSWDPRLGRVTTRRRCAVLLPGEVKPVGPRRLQAALRHLSQPSLLALRPDDPLWVNGLGRAEQVGSCAYLCAPGGARLAPFCHARSFLTDLLRFCRAATLRSPPRHRRRVVWHRRAPQDWQGGAFQGPQREVERWLPMGGD